MPFARKGRHRAPRQPRRTGAVAVPVVLLAAGGGAFAGLSGAPGLPSSSRAAIASTPSTTLATGSGSGFLQDLGVLDGTAATGSAQQRARAAALDRASRSTRPTAPAGSATAGTARVQGSAESLRAAALADADTEAGPQAAGRLARLAAADAATRAAAARQAAQATHARLVLAHAAQLRAGRVRAALKAATTYVRPAAGPVTSPFGYRWGKLHAGVDFGAPYGSPVRAVAAGTIIEAGYDGGGYGNFVHVQHADGTVTTYNHMSQVVRTSGSVAAGDVLGLIGSTGHSTGPHLHFEVRIDGQPVDPAPWLVSHGIAL